MRDRDTGAGERSDGDRDEYELLHQESSRFLVSPNEIPSRPSDLRPAR